MTVRVEIESEAEFQLDGLERWWREHRPSAASQVVDELQRIVNALAENPEIGVRYVRPNILNVRWMRMRKTPYKVYYHYDPARPVVTIVAAWSAMRGHGPTLKAR